jgi:hypothetical protein
MTVDLASYGAGVLYLPVRSKGIVRGGIRGSVRA